MDQQKIIHATSLCILGKGVLLLGPSGMGKSDLALRLLHCASPLLDAPCRLISDDQTVIMLKDTKLIAQAPQQLAGRMEVRGVGVLQFDHVENIEIVLALDLGSDTPPARVPDLYAHHTALLGVEVPTLPLSPFEASAPEKVISLVQAITAGKLNNDI